MSFDTVREEVEAKFAAEWAVRTPISYGTNLDFTPTAGVSWVRVAIVPFDSVNAQLGDGFTRQDGIISVQIFVPKNSGEKEALEHADFVRGIYQNDFFGGIRTRATSITRIGSQDDLWYQLNADTTYQFDEFS